MIPANLADHGLIHDRRQQTGHNIDRRAQHHQDRPHQHEGHTQPLLRIRHKTTEPGLRLRTENHFADARKIDQEVGDPDQGAEIERRHRRLPGPPLPENAQYKDGRDRRRKGHRDLVDRLENSPELVPLG